MKFVKESCNYNLYELTQTELDDLMRLFDSAQLFETSTSTNEGATTRFFSKEDVIEHCDNYFFYFGIHIETSQKIILIMTRNEIHEITLPTFKLWITDIK